MDLILAQTANPHCQVQAVEIQMTVVARESNFTVCSVKMVTTQIRLVVWMSIGNRRRVRGPAVVTAHVAVIPFHR